jgi:CYTH domain-containing protein
MGAAVPTTENTVFPESKYARIERERRFLLNEFPAGLTRASEHVQIWDNYITNTRMRLRKVRLLPSGQYINKLTQKYAPDPNDSSRTIITNTYLSAAEYEVLSIFEGSEIRKNRYPFEYEGRKYSIDLFIGPLWGLVLAETEFETDEEMAALPMPLFAALEVTHDPTFTGARLVDLTTAEIREWLRKNYPVSNPSS